MNESERMCWNCKFWIYRDYELGECHLATDLLSRLKIRSSHGGTPYRLDVPLHMTRDEWEEGERRCETCREWEQPRGRPGKGAGVCLDLLKYRESRGEDSSGGVYGDLAQKCRTFKPHRCNAWKARPSVKGADEGSRNK